MPPAKTIERFRLQVAYDPTATTRGAYVKDQNGKINFGNATLLAVHKGDVLDVERSHNPPKGTFQESYNIERWSPAEDRPTNGAPAVNRPVTRARTDPHDQMNMFITAMMKEWMTGYAACLMISSEQRMAPINAAVVTQAMDALSAAYRRFHNIRTQSVEPQEPDHDPRDDMQDEIPF